MDVLSLQHCSSVGVRRVINPSQSAIHPSDNDNQRCTEAEDALPSLSTTHPASLRLGSYLENVSLFVSAQRFCVF